MKLSEKIKILAESAKYDVSCSSSGSTRPNTPDGIGSASKAGVCHSWSDDGRCVSLLKILMTNVCVYDCAFCVNRVSNDLPRAALTPEELADLTINFYRRNYIEGLFLSSGIIRSPDYTMELMIKALRLLRETRRFNGYIHIKAIPGSDPRLLREAGFLADRMSANIELPTRKSLALLAPQKNKKNIIGAISEIKEGIDEHTPLRGKKLKRFVPAGQSTQLIIGASPESDFTIVNLAGALYERAGLKRVYYSAYIPVSAENPLLPVRPPQLRRENRLYQADWLLRFYRFSPSEILDDSSPFLDLELDPKCAWAVRHYEHFPVDINRADYDTLLRVPGIGVLSAKRILRARRAGRLTFSDLKKIGVVMKRARYFIICSGVTDGSLPDSADILRAKLLEKKKPEDHRQLSLFSGGPDHPDPESSLSVITGNL